MKELRGSDVIRPHFPYLLVVAGLAVLAYGDGDRSPPFPALCRSWRMGMSMAHCGWHCCMQGWPYGLVLRPDDHHVPSADFRGSGPVVSPPIPFRNWAWANSHSHVRGSPFDLVAVFRTMELVVATWRCGSHLARVERGGALPRGSGEAEPFC